MNNNTYKIYYFSKKNQIDHIKLPVSVKIDSYCLYKEYVVAKLQEHLANFKGKKRDFMALNEALNKMSTPTPYT